MVNREPFDFLDIVDGLETNEFLCLILHPSVSMRFESWDQLWVQGHLLFEKDKPDKAYAFLKTEKPRNKSIFVVAIYQDDSRQEQYISYENSFSRSTTTKELRADFSRFMSSGLKKAYSTDLAQLQVEATRVVLPPQVDHDAPTMLDGDYTRTQVVVSSSRTSLFKRLIWWVVDWIRPWLEGK